MQTDQPPNTTPNLTGKSVEKRRLLYGALLVVAAAVLVLVSGLGYIYAVTPATIRTPKMEHYHIRLQVLVNGKAQNFGDQKYQTGYAKDQCSGELAAQPFHFHDNKDQFVHVHWEGMSGGLLLKYYGWNYVGGQDGALGYRTDRLPRVQSVPIHGKTLQAIPKDATFYVYIGDAKGYKEKHFQDFTAQDLEVFFGVTSNSPSHDLNKQRSFLDALSPRAYAHGDEVHTTLAADDESESERLTRLNNLIGNAVIFVQKDKPSDEQVKARFGQLMPLSDSTCGG